MKKNLPSFSVKYFCHQYNTSQQLKWFFVWTCAKPVSIYTYITDKTSWKFTKHGVRLHFHLLHYISMYMTSHLKRPHSKRNNSWIRITLTLWIYSEIFYQVNLFSPHSCAGANKETQTNKIVLLFKATICRSITPIHDNQITIED